MSTKQKQPEQQALPTTGQQPEEQKVEAPKPTGSAQGETAVVVLSPFRQRLAKYFEDQHPDLTADAEADRLACQWADELEERLARYADTEGRTLQPIRGLFLLFVVTSVVSFFFNILGRRFFIDSEWLLAVPSLLFSSLLFGLGYVGRRRMFSYADLRPVDITEPAEPLGTDVQPRIEEVAREIEKLMDEERFYLNFDLHVEDVARKLGTNSKYVSLALNQIVGVTFSDYVNRRRIAYACELQRQQPELPMTEIARRSGYTAMASFYRNMKRWGGEIGN
jgi:AraC-like DNA-binding protein